MAELVDALDLGSSGVTRESSILSACIFFLTYRSESNKLNLGDDMEGRCELCGRKEPCDPCLGLKKSEDKKKNLTV